MKDILIDKETLGAKDILSHMMPYVGALWYLYAVWICAVVIGGIVRYIPKKFRNYSLIFCALCMYLVPTDKWYVAFAFSFVLLGYFLRVQGFKLEWFDNHFRLGIVSLMIYAVLLVFYKYEYSVYVAGSNLFTNNVVYKQILVDGYRFMIGVLGANSIGFVLHWIWKLILQTRVKLTKIVINALERVGKLSLEMYCTQYLVVEHIFPKVLDLLNISDTITENPYICYFWWRHTVGIGLTFCVYFTCLFLKKKIGRWIY